MQKQILNVQEVSEILHKHEQTIYRWYREGVIPGHKLGNSLYFDYEEIKGAIFKKSISEERKKAGGLWK